MQQRSRFLTVGDAAPGHQPDSDRRWSLVTGGVPVEECMGPTIRVISCCNLANFLSAFLLNCELRGSPPLSRPESTRDLGSYYSG